MSLTVGQKVGPYEIVEEAGAGGMGQVFKAKDPRLDRLVAIKVLPASMHLSPEMKQRFEREAKSISSLNHPNICTLYDIGEEGGIDYLVMEFIEGETLSDRIKKGPMPLSDLLEIGMQIADALDKAHSQGLVHRDLKPANVMLTRDGAKLLDFGLAKLQISDGVVGGATNITQTTPMTGLTGAGTIIGTLSYMAPEQLEGNEADGRSDIFAFGALLYEMVTGRQAFEGKSQASLIAGILEREPPPISAHSSMSPPALERLIRKSLAKDPEKRWQSARDLGDELRWIMQSGSQAGIPLKLAAKRKFRFRLASIGTLVASLVAVGFASLWFNRPVPDPNVMRFTIETDASLSQVSWPRISPDGKYLAFIGDAEDGETRIYIRPISSLDAYPLAGTENAERPFWSPDSKHLAFVVNRRQIKKIAVGGGPAQLIGESPQGADGSWGSDGIIIFDGGPTDSIRQISAAGGIASGATKIYRDQAETSHAWPWFLPDGRHFLYMAYVTPADGSSDRNILKIGSLDSDEVTTLFPVDSRAEYCAPGYLIYMRAGILLAHPFDADSRELAGEPFPLADQIGMGEVELAHFGASDQGTLAIQSDYQIAQSRLAWFDRSGEEIEQIGADGSYENIALSPDEKRLAYAVNDNESDRSDIWIIDLDRKVPSRFTYGGSNEVWPVWSNDAKYLYYSSDSLGRFMNMRKQASGLGQAEMIAYSDTGHLAPYCLSPDGKTLYGSYYGTGWEIAKVKNLESGGAKELLINTKFTEIGARVSPAGRYLAYSSNETGRHEIYVVDLEGGGKWQISSTGARNAEWSKSGKELFYITADWDFTAVPITTNGQFKAGKPELLFNRQILTGGYGSRRYAVSNDGQRFLINTPIQKSGGAEFLVILNWYKEFEK